MIFGYRLEGSLRHVIRSELAGGPRSLDELSADLTAEMDVKPEEVRNAAYFMAGTGLVRVAEENTYHLTEEGYSCCRQ